MIVKQEKGRDLAILSSQFTLKRNLSKTFCNISNASGIIEVI